MESTFPHAQKQEIINSHRLTMQWNGISQWAQKKNQSNLHDNVLSEKISTSINLALSNSHIKIN